MRDTHAGRYETKSEVHPRKLKRKSIDGAAKGRKQN